MRAFCSKGKTNPYRQSQTVGGGEEFAVQERGGEWWTTRLSGPGDGQSQTFGRYNHVHLQLILIYNEYCKSF